MSHSPIYLDNNATTAVDPVVLEAMLPYFTELPGNAGSSGHSFGWDAEEAIELAREQVAGLIGATAPEIIFTAGATESINLVFANIKSGHVITVVTEHKAVLASCQELEKRGVTTTYLPVDSHGRVNLNDLKESIKDETCLICIMFANNETGVIQDVEGIAGIAKEKDIPFLCDATQAMGKVPVSIEGIDYLACSAHKFYGPKGVGALYISKNIDIKTMHPIIHGGSQELGLRSGTLNVPGIVGLGKACEIAASCLDDSNARIKKLRNDLERTLLSIPGTKVNGETEYRLPNTCNLTFANIEGQMVLESLGKEIALATGSACNADLTEPSHVLKGMGMSSESILGSVRISLGRFTTEEEIKYATVRIKEVVSSLSN